MPGNLKCKMKTSSHMLYREAELLKESIGESPLNKENVGRRQELCRLLELLLLNDLDYALDKKVEQDLWNLVFRNPITALQIKAAERKNSSQSHQSQLAFSLDSASGFYFQLLQKIACANELDKLCHIPASNLGLISTWNSKGKGNRSSVLYICQHCMVHLGDIARYRGQSLQAETFYRNAAELIPSNGHAYNQLAILEASSGEKLSTVFFYVRSLAVQHPFPAAATNLQKLYTKMISDGANSEIKSRMSSYEYISAFLQFQALVHLGTDFQKAEQVLCQLTTSLPALIIAEKLETWHLLQMAAICMFSVGHATGFLEGPTRHGNNSTKQKEPLLSQDERSALSLGLDLVAAMLNALILPLHAVINPQESGDYYTIPVVKVLLDWLLLYHHSFPGEAFKKRPQIWHGLCKLLNDLKPSEKEDPITEGVPLHEDWDLQCFLPLQKAHVSLNFSSDNGDTLHDSELNKARIIRLRILALKFSEQEFSGSKVISVNSRENGSKEFSAVQSSILTEQVLHQIQELSVSSSQTNNPVDDSPGIPSRGVKSSSGASQGLEVRFKLDEEVSSTQPKPPEHSKVQVREKKSTRQNVALQAIMQQRASQQNYANSNQAKDNHCMLNPPKVEDKRPWMSPYNMIQNQSTVNQMNMRPGYGMPPAPPNLLAQNMTAQKVPNQGLSSQGLGTQGIQFSSGPSAQGLDYSFNQFNVQQEQQQPPPNQSVMQRPMSCLTNEQAGQNQGPSQQYMNSPTGMVWNYVSYLPVGPQPLGTPNLHGSQGSQGQQGTSQVVSTHSHPLLLPQAPPRPSHHIVQPGFLLNTGDVQQNLMGDTYNTHGSGHVARDAALAYHYANNIRMQNGDGQTSMLSSTNLQTNQGSLGNQAGNSEMGANTYSLFSSPWCSALAAPRNSKDSPSRNERDQVVMQPRIQSLWSGPGPSPLERLLEQQKQRREAANQ